MAQQRQEGSSPPVDLHAHVTSDTILEVRTGRMKPMRGLTVESGIDKTVRDGPVRVTKTGLEEDEHDPTFHGGVDKAVHGYCSAHYLSWQADFPSAAPAFVPGAFGENFVFAHLNERNLCIGDIFTTSGSGDPPIFQVSLPRQPCFKLNHRFQLKNFAPNTWKTSRTGWYFRVLREGTVQAGDTIRLVERRHPKWTIERVQEYLHRDPGNAEMNEELAGIEEFGAECKEQFKGRVAKQRAKERKLKLARQEPKWREFRVVEKEKETARIVSFILEAVEPLSGQDGDGVELRPGAHAKLKLGNGLVRAFSIVDGNRNRFQLGVALDEKSRGGSRYLHEVVQVGHTVQVGAITVAVSIPTAASHHVFVVAGVGITAFLSLIELYKRIHYSVDLHYAVRSVDDIPFRERLAKLGSDCVIYNKAAGQRLNVGDIIENMHWNSHLYVCGPKGLMDEAAKETRAHGIPDNEVHFEAFEADVSGDPFEAVVANKDGRVIKVGEEESLLESLQKHFDDVDSSCGVGNCGTCRVRLRDGRVDHRGTALTEDDKATSMLSCVSRGIGRIIIEI
ncbi:hypothetical protein MFIFM68171_04072 [Madurella fahalii]|uniref:Uncharacterized protein n=1 Tax=Madurella fahalii TaxID=1157608 RepID=A0ABQ0G802_9PEZI